jgi:hypothetical protein
MKKTITICSSANFYQRVIEIRNQLEDMGYQTIVPVTALKMEKSGDFDASHYRTWLANDDDYHKKAELMRKHFDEVTNGDAILVINEEKHGKANYIGGNVLMEMALAFYQKKPIFILNGLPHESAFEEEIKGMTPILLHGDLSKIKL